mgnify:FL=1
MNEAEDMFDMKINKDPKVYHPASTTESPDKRGNQDPQNNI